MMLGPCYTYSQKPWVQRGGWIRKQSMCTSGSKTGELGLSKPVETLMNLLQAQMQDTELQDLMFSIVNFNLLSLIFNCFLSYLSFGMRKFIFVITYWKCVTYSLVLHGFTVK